MYKFVKAYESYGSTHYPIQALYEKEFEILDSATEAKVIEYLNFHYVNRWGKELTIRDFEGVAEMNIKPSRTFIMNGVLVKYEKIL